MVDWKKKFDDYLFRSREMMRVGDDLMIWVKDLRANPKDVDDLIFSGYITARAEEAYKLAGGLLDASENALQVRAKELGVEIKC